MSGHEYFDILQEIVSVDMAGQNYYTISLWKAGLPYTMKELSPPIKTCPPYRKKFSPPMDN